MNSTIPFFRPSIGQDEILAVTESLSSGWLTTGPQTAAFESEFREFLGGDVHAIAVNSATAALHLGLEALGVVAGDEVIVPTMTFTATAEVIRYLGAIPVFVDMNEDSLCIDVNSIASAITEKTKVIMPVHFAGRSCDMTGIRTLAERFNLKILDDAAHALPTRHNGHLIGSSKLGADATAFSFYANKTMTTGEGGMLVTTNDRIADRCRKMRLHGIDRDVFDRFTNIKSSWLYDVIEAGYKYNLTDLASSIGRVQLRKVDEFRQTRAMLAQRYDRALAGSKLTLPPPAAQGDSHSWHLYIVQIQDDAPVDRNQFIQRLQERGIGTSVHYKPLHQMSYWKPLANGKIFAAADNYFRRCVSLPLFMDMTEAEQCFVIDTVLEVMDK